MRADPDTTTTTTTAAATPTGAPATPTDLPQQETPMLRPRPHPTLIRRKLGVLAAGALAACVLFAALAEDLFARTGAVIIKSGQRYEGEIEENEDGSVVVTDGDNVVRIQAGNIKEIIYDEDEPADAGEEPTEDDDMAGGAAAAEEDLRQQLAELPEDDVESRLAIAGDAIDAGAHEFAIEVLEEVQAIEPRNRQATRLMARAKRELKEAGGATGKSKKGKAAKAKKGKTTKRKAGDGDEEPADDDERPAAQRPGAATRLVTADEINQVRAAEWREGENVRVRVSGDLKRRYLGSADIEPAAFNRMTPADQAWEIMENGSDAMRREIVFIGDPPAMADFRRNVHKVVATGCATAGCHSPKEKEPAGDFVLVTENTDEAVYTNFLILSQYRVVDGDSERAMIDRDRPADSLLLEYGLPPASADAPHPEAPKYRGVFRNGKRDPRYNAILNWMSDSLNPIQPEYAVDLTREPGGANDDEDPGESDEEAATAEEDEAAEEEPAPRRGKAKRGGRAKGGADDADAAIEAEVEVETAGLEDEAKVDQPAGGGTTSQVTTGADADEIARQPIDPTGRRIYRPKGPGKE